MWSTFTTTPRWARSPEERRPRGSAIYRFAPFDFAQDLRNAWNVESSRLRRFVFFVGQAVFAVYCFEVITYVHHYGLVRADGGAGVNGGPNQRAATLRFGGRAT